METWNIILVTFPSQHLLASTFLRFQEHYESPEFRGRVFDREQFEDWYAKTNGEFTYYSDWAGFNLPSAVFRPFINGAFDPLTRKERWLLDAVRDLQEPYYVIGVADGDTETLPHEVVHGLFTLYPDYRRDVVAALGRFKLRQLHNKLKSLGYDESVFDDESNAYLTTGTNPQWKLKGLRPAIRVMRELFERHFGFRIESRAGNKSLVNRIHKLRFTENGVR